MLGKSTDNRIFFFIWIPEDALNYRNYSVHTEYHAIRKQCLFALNREWAKIGWLCADSNPRDKFPVQYCNLQNQIGFTSFIFLCFVPINTSFDGITTYPTQLHFILIISFFKCYRLMLKINTFLAITSK